MALSNSCPLVSPKSGISSSRATRMPIFWNSGSQAMSQRATSGRAPELAETSTLSCSSAHSWDTAFTLMPGFSASKAGISTFVSVSFSADWAL